MDSDERGVWHDTIRHHRNELDYGRIYQGARETQAFALAAVYSRTSERAEAFASKHGIPLTFTDIGEMAASSEVDAVYIASPTSLHAEQAIICMNAGKHVLCEKPAASNSRELEAMIKTARERGVVFMEAMKSSFMPGFEAIRELLPSLGPIRRYTASYCQYSSRYDKYKAGEVFERLQAGILQWRVDGSGRVLPVSACFAVRQAGAHCRERNDAGFGRGWPGQRHRGL